MRHKGELAGDLCSCEHANSGCHQVEGLVQVPPVLVHKRTHVILQLGEDALDRLQVRRVRRKTHIVDAIRLHILVPPVVVDARVVVQHNAGVRLHLPRQPRDIGVHVRVKTLQEQAPVVGGLRIADYHGLRPQHAVGQRHPHHRARPLHRPRVPVAQDAGHVPTGSAEAT